MQLVTFESIVEESRANGKQDSIRIVCDQLEITEDRVCVLDSESSRYALKNQSSSLMVLGHSNATGIGPYNKAKDFVAALNKKVSKHDRAQITDVYFIACEVGYYDKENSQTLAQKIANQLDKAGYAGEQVLRVHAITNGSERTHADAVGMRVELNENGNINAFTLDQQQTELLACADQSESFKNANKGKLAGLRVKPKTTIIGHQHIMQAFDEPNFVFVPLTKTAQHKQEIKNEAEKLACAIEKMAKRTINKTFKLKTIKKKRKKFISNVEGLAAKIRGNPERAEKQVQDKIDHYRKINENNNYAKKHHRKNTGLANSAFCNFLLTVHKELLSTQSTPRRLLPGDEPYMYNNNNLSGTDEEQVPLLNNHFNAEEEEVNNETINNYIQQAIKFVNSDIAKNTFIGGENRTQLISKLTDLGTTLTTEHQKAEKSGKADAMKQATNAAKQTCTLMEKLSYGKSKNKNIERIDKYQKAVKSSSVPTTIFKALLCIALGALTAVVGGVILGVYFTRTSHNGRVNQVCRTALKAIPEEEPNHDPVAVSTM